MPVLDHVGQELVAGDGVVLVAGIGDPSAVRDQVFRSLDLTGHGEADRLSDAYELDFHWHTVYGICCHPPKPSGSILQMVPQYCTGGGGGA